MKTLGKIDKLCKVLPEILENFRKKMTVLCLACSVQGKKNGKISGYSLNRNVMYFVNLNESALLRD